MKTICTQCRKAYQQSEAYENVNDLPPLCVRCALIWITRDDDFDQEPMPEDVEWAWERSGQVTQDELNEIAAEARRYPDEGFQCEQCGSHLNTDEYWYQGNFCCSEAEKSAHEQDRLADEAKTQAEQVWFQENFERLYDEALEENLDRLYDEAAAEDFQRQIDAELEAEEAQRNADEEAYREMYEYYTSWRFKLRSLLEKIRWWRS